MKKSVISWLATAGLTLSAQAADLGDGLKDPLPDTLTYKGVTIYGALDIGYAYETSGSPVGGSYFGINTNQWAVPYGYKPISTLNTIGYSSIGVKFEESIGYGWQALGRLDTGFDILTGALDDACALNVRNNGKPLAQQTVAGPATRCGQAINGDSYAGVSNPVYGTLTVGHHNSLDTDALAGYDPALLYSFSLITWSPTLGGGTGATETAKWDNSVKYAYVHGPFHAQVMYAQGEQDSSLHGNSYAGNIGATWRGLSIDAVYTMERDAVAAFSYGVGGCGTATKPSCGTLSGIAQNAEAWTILSKYTFDLNGGFKDGGIAGKLTFYAGYQHNQLSDPSKQLSAGDTIVGGYVLGAVNNTAYLYGDKTLATGWAGVRYESGAWSLAAAYYRTNQEFFKNSGASAPCSDRSHSNCSGAVDVASLSAMYAINKHLDLYAGVSWSELTGGLAAGAPNPEDTAFLTGLILKF